MRAALVATLALRAYCTLVAAAVPLAFPNDYLWQSNFLPDHFTLANAAPGGPHPAYTLLDYLLRPWDRWDTSWYTDIAQHGYRTFGSTAFMPLYPLLIRIAAPLVGGNLLAAALLLATSATFFALLALYRLAERLAPGRGLGPYALLVAAVLPTSFFLMAGYTESLFLALSLWAILAALDGRWGRMALLAGLAALTRQQGILLAIPAAPSAWRGLRGLWRRAGGERGASATAVAVLAPLGAAAAPAVVYGGWLGALHLVFHAPSPWDVLTVVPGWGLRLTWPGSGLIADATLLIQRPPDLAPFIDTTALDLIVAAAAALALVAAARRLPLGLTLYLAGSWCAALVKVAPIGLTVSAGRYMLALLPLCVVPAGWLAHSGVVRRVIWILAGGVYMTVNLGLFVLWSWIG